MILAREFFDAEKELKYKFGVAKAIERNADDCIQVSVLYPDRLSAVLMLFS